MMCDNPKTATIPVEHIDGGKPGFVVVMGPWTDAKRDAGTITIRVGGGHVYKVNAVELIKAVAFANNPPGGGEAAKEKEPIQKWTTRGSGGSARVKLASVLVSTVIVDGQPVRDGDDPESPLLRVGSVMAYSMLRLIDEGGLKHVPLRPEMREEPNV